MTIIRRRKNRVVIILGAGFPLPWGAPKSGKIKDLVVDELMASPFSFIAHLLLVLVKEIELAPDNGEFTFRANGIRLSQLLLIGLFLDGELGVVDEIDAQVVTKDAVLRNRITQRRVIIQIEGYLPAVQLALAKKNFGGFHDWL